jgi:uncharacterized membrane protein
VELSYLIHTKDFIVILGHDNAPLSDVAYWPIIAGILGGLVIVPFGVIDWPAIPAGTRAKSIGAMHGVGNVVVVQLFVASWYVWSRAGVPLSASAYVFLFLGVGLALWTGWLGGELVDRLGGVDPSANVNAPSSLSGRPVREGVSATQRER